MNFRLFKLPFLAIALSGALLVTSCDDNDDINDDDMFTVSGNANGAQEVPAVNTTATGTLSGTYNRNTNTLNYNISWNGLSSLVSLAHFHGPAGVGVSAGPMVDINVGTNTGMTASVSGSVVVHDTVETALMNGNVYYNIHTVNNPNGEIRGQVLLTNQ